MKVSRKLVAVAVAGACTVSAAGLAPAASAQNSTVDATMTPNYYIEARIFKDAGNGDPTHWTTSAWTFHGAAHQSMTRIRDTATIQVWGASVLGGSCSAGFNGQNPTGSCQSNWSTTSSAKTLWWENGNAAESDLTGVAHPTFGTYWMKVCSEASAYSASLGIHGDVTACVG